MKERYCRDCDVRLSIGTHQSGLCTSCAIKNSIENARQLHEKSGPYYEKWKAGVKAAAERL